MNAPVPQTTRRRRDLRILHVILSLGCGGAERLVKVLSVHAAKNGHKVHVACLDSAPEAPEEFAPYDIPLVLLKRRPGVFDPRACLALARFVRARRIDMLHAHDLTSALQSSAASLVTGTPVVFTEHSRHYLEERRLRRLEKRVISSMVSVVAEVSPLLAEASRDRDGVRPEKLRVIANGVDVAQFAGAGPGRFRASLGVAPNQRLVGMVGRLENIKGPQVLLEAFGLLARTRPDLVLAFVGPGGLAKPLADRALDLGLGDRVLLAGARDDIPRVLADLDLVVLPSLSEGLPFALLEAMAAGKPVVASAVGYIPSVLHNGRTGVLSPPGDSESLAAAMALLLENPEVARDMGRNAQAEVERRFSLNGMLEAYDDLYRELCPDGGVEA